MDPHGRHHHSVSKEKEKADGQHRTRAEQRHDQAEGTPHCLRIGCHVLGLNSYNGRVAAADDSLHRALLALHKAVLNAERAQLEGIHGELSNTAFLQLVSDPIRYGWLKPVSALILAFEEDEDEREPEDELVAQTRELLLPPKKKTPFGRRYLSLMQREPDLVLAHADLVKRLR
jgi:hypothetical protein